jgi:superfamily II DNA/RNA helicase
MPNRIRSLANSILHNPEHINISISQPAEGIDQQVYKVFDSQKVPLIQELLKGTTYSSSIIFASTKEKVKLLYKALKAIGIKVKAFHSDLEQNEREDILREFKNRQLPVIIGTDALSRGIDVEGIDLVVNYDCPSDAEDYIHRIGRTARAATKGTAITLVNERDQGKLRNIQDLISKEIAVMPLPEHIGEAPEFKPVSSDNRKKGKSKSWKNNKPRKQVN